MVGIHVMQDRREMLRQAGIAYTYTPPPCLRAKRAWQSREQKFPHNRAESSRRDGDLAVEATEAARKVQQCT
eukprot:scaffold175482_cov35-Prasinocladus_malaysianus.AAC.1